MRTLELIVPSPAAPARLDQFLAVNLHGVSRRRVKALIDAQAVRVDGRVERRGGRKLAPGQRVAVSYRPSQLAQPPALGREALLARGDGWWAVAKPPGVPSHRTSEEGGVGVPELAAALVAGARDVAPVHRLDRETSGVLLLATPEARGALSSAFAAREVAKRYLAVVSAAPGVGAGELSGQDRQGRPMSARFEVLRRSADGTRAEVAVSPRQGRTHQVRLLLAGAGWPIVGDLVHGRPLPGGAPRMALHCAELRWADEVVACPPPQGWDALLEPPAAAAPERPCAPRHQPAKASRRGAPTAAQPPQAQRRRRLVVSEATARIIGAGHPWVIADRDTGSLAGLRPGDVVDLIGRRSGRFIAMAAVDPEARVCARVVSRRRLAVLDAAGFRSRAERAVAKRQALLGAPDTDCLRLVHGQADGLPGLWVDKWGDCLVATRLSRCAEGYEDAVYRVLAERFEGLPLYRKDHLSDLRAAAGAGGDRLPGGWIAAPPQGHPAAAGRWTVREAGAAFEVAPLAGLTTGLYPDQRANRRLLSARVPKGAGWVGANLFAHTGAFSVSLALAGVARVHTVDLSPRYLDVYRRNLTLNGLAERDHPAVAADALSWLASAPPLNVVVVDPPAFARDRRKKGRGWDAQRDYADLVEAAARRLAPGGLLLCCHNLRRAKKGWLRKQVEAGLSRAGRKLVATAPAGPAEDFPTLRGFPEGHTFRGVLVTVR
ncbi:MAG: hypothetical protein CSA66_07645 [Proteobacteria bacterium]|nr:MAG: hypothetical protein CSA66_07645 [Pseudomonadota bacterium]